MVVREYGEERHKVAVEKLERLCEVGQRGKPALVTDLMGDPICRIRLFPLHIMLVSNYNRILPLFTGLDYLNNETLDQSSIYKSVNW